MKLSKFEQKILKDSKRVKGHSSATLKSKSLALRTMIGIIGNMRVEDLEQKHGEKVIQTLRFRGLVGTSINNYMTNLNACLQRASEWGLVSDPHPFKKIKKLKQVKKRPAFIPQNKLAKFLGGIPSEKKKLTIAAFLATGLRRCELLRLVWGDILFDTMQFRVFRKKTGEEQILPINEWFWQILLEIQKITASDDSSLIFPWWNHPDSVTHFVKKELVYGGFPDLHLHHLRHTFATNYMAAGGDIFYLRELLGHSDIKTTMIYAHTDEQVLRKETNRVYVPMGFDSAADDYKNAEAA